MHVMITGYKILDPIVGSQALRNLYGNEDEIDAVAGLAASGQGVGTTTVPEPTTLALMGLGLTDLGFMKRKTTR